MNVAVNSRANILKLETKGGHRSGIAIWWPTLHCEESALLSIVMPEPEKVWLKILLCHVLRKVSNFISWPFHDRAASQRMGRKKGRNWININIVTHGATKPSSGRLRHSVYPIWWSSKNTVVMNRILAHSSLLAIKLKRRHWFQHARMFIWFWEPRLISKRETSGSVPRFF